MAIVTERGRLHLKGEVKSGVSKAGNPWANQQIVVEVYGFNNSIKRVALKTNKSDLLYAIEAMPVGTEVEIKYSVSAREWNGAWYNDVELVSIDSLAKSAETATRPVATPAPKADPAPVSNDAPGTDLPF